MNDWFTKTSHTHLRNWTEEKPPWPSKTAAKEKPSRGSLGRRMISSSISSRGPCKATDPHLIAGASVKDDDGASIAMAEQHPLLLLLLLMLLKLNFLWLWRFCLELERVLLWLWLWSLLKRLNLCVCGLDNAIGKVKLIQSLKTLKVRLERVSCVVVVFGGRWG